MNGKHSKMFSVIIGSVTFALSVSYIVVYFQWREILSVLARVNFFWLLGGGFFSILLYWLIRALRWSILLQSVGVQIHFLRLYLIGAVSMAFSIITPLQAGEAVKIELLKKTGDLNRLPGYSVFIVEKMMDIVVVGLLAAVCVLMGLVGFLDEKIILFTSVAAVAGFVIILIIIQAIRPPESSLLGRFLIPLNHCLRNAKKLAVIMALTLAGWLVVALGWYFCLRSISISLPFFQALALTSIMTLVNVLSMIPGAIGISEAGIAAFLVYLGYTEPMGQAGGLILRIYGFMLLLLGILHYIVIKLMRSQRAQPGS